MLRLGLCIPNKKRIIPSPLHEGMIKDHPERRGTFHPNGDGTGQVTLRPLVERTKGLDGRERVKIVATPDEAEEILRKIRERAARENRDVRVLETWRETIKRPVVVKAVRSKPTNLIRAFLKIAYELGVYWLSLSYASHVSGLPIARAIVTGVVSDRELCRTGFQRFRARACRDRLDKRKSLTRQAKPAFPLPITPKLA